MVCCDVVDLGLVLSPGWQGAPDSKKHKCRIFWQSVEHEEPNGNGEAGPARTEPADNGNGITDPVLLRLMQRRQELSQ